MSIEISLASNIDPVIRLISAINRFRCPEIGTDIKLSYERSFKSVGSHTKTKALTTQADAARLAFAEAIIASRRSTRDAYELLKKNELEYLPLINQILLSCKVQPEAARLDEKLVFQWSSGIEKSKVFYKSEALMYEMVMTLACEAMGNAGLACDACVNGDFALAGRNFKQAATILRYLSEEQLPQWIARGTDVKDAQLPCEASVAASDALRLFFLAAGQQMAVATTLSKPGKSNYGLVAKLCLGISEQLDQFQSTMRSKAGGQVTRIDPVFFTFVTFQINLQRALSFYFLSLSYWDQGDYGVGIAYLKKAMVDLPKSEKQLKVLDKDLKAFKEEMKKNAQLI